MPNLNYIYGDPTIWTRGVGSRPMRCLWLTDSIATDWSPTFYGLLPNLQGQDGNLHNGQGGGVTPITNPGTWVASYDTYDPFCTAGGGTLHANVSAGATSIQVDMPSTNTGWWGPSMILTITDGTNTDTIKLANSGTFARQQTPNNPQTIDISTSSPAALTHAYAAGATVTWQRPSGVGHYWWARNGEIVFAGGASPSSANSSQNRLAEWYLTEADSGLSEDTYKQVQGWANQQLKVTLFYLATPKATNVNNVQLAGYKSESTPWFNAANQLPGVPFSAWAATPTIKSVSMTVPKPMSYGATTGCGFVVQSSGIGTFAAGDVFVPIAWYVEPTGATSGYGMIFAGCAGTCIWNYSNDGLYTDGSTYRPIFMSPAFVSAFVTLAQIDTLIINLGHNAPAPDAATAETGYRQIISTCRAGNSALRAILVTNYATPTGGSQETLTQAAMQTVAQDAGVMTCDLFALMDNPTFNNAYLADGTHPNSTTGNVIFATAVLGLLDAAATAAAKSGGGRKTRFPQVGL